MSDSRNNRLVIDGGQIKEDEHISSYKSIPESDTDFRKSKSSLSKSKEKVSGDGAEEKLLQKEDDVKITPRVDMDAKYVVESYTNGDAKIELDANKRQFTGLTKEELMKYADDPFWVRLRWFMFVLFWALWLCMLAGAIVVIVQAPRCAAPTPKTWFEKGPLVESSLSYKEMESKLATLEGAGVQGVFTALCSDTYDITPTCFEDLKAFIAKAKERSIKIIVDLTANFVEKSHAWFEASENRTEPYDSYFIWRNGSADIDEASKLPNPPNNWRSTKDTSAWTWSDKRRQYYLHQFEENQPDLDFNNPNVVREFSGVLTKIMGAGASGIRLHNARLLLVNTSFVDEKADHGKGSVPGVVHTEYRFLRHTQTSDQPGLKTLLENWSYLVDHNGTNPGMGETVFTLAEDGIPGAEMFLVGEKQPFLRPVSSRPLEITKDNLISAADQINKRLVNWTALKLLGPSGAGEALAGFAMLLPAAPVMDLEQLFQDGNGTVPNAAVVHLVQQRSDASVEHGNFSVGAVPAGNTSFALACARWKPLHTGYVAVFNPDEVDLHANLTSLSNSLPETLTVHYAPHNYTNMAAVKRDTVLVPSLSTVVLSYVPYVSDKKEE